MFEKVELTSEEHENILKFDNEINNLIIGNDDKIYLSYFIKSLLSNNFISAAPTGFIFIEKFLRTELIFHRIKKEGKEKDFLTLLDDIEDLLENGNRGGNKGKDLYESFRRKTDAYGVDSAITKEEIHKSIGEFLDYIDSNGALPKSQLSFHNICKELKNEGLLAKNQSDDLKKFYTKYRNVVQHGLFKRLFDLYFKGETTLVVGGDFFTGKIQEHNPKKSNLLFRQFAIEEIFKDVCVEIFITLQELLQIFNKFGKINKL